MGALARARSMNGARVAAFSVRAVGLALACSILPPLRAAMAQEGPTHYAEYRADAIVGSGTTVQGGAGIVVPLDIYVRLGFDGAIGTTWRDGTTRGSGRVDGIARFLLDPFREVPVGLSIGGGVSVPYVVGESHVRPFLTAVIDVEGRVRGPVTPALQVGLGGGARVGIVLRTSRSRYR